VLDDYVGQKGIKHIRFFGDGEPTLEFELIKKIHAYAKTINPNIIAEIQTNGVFNETIAKWLGQNMDYIFVSVDLLPKDHDKYRVTKSGEPSSPFVLKTLAVLHSMKDKKAKVGIRATITKYNIDNQKQAIDYYHDNFGIKIFWCDPKFSAVYDPADKKIVRIDLMHFAKSFMDAQAHAWKRDIFYESIFTANFDMKTNKACRACLPMPHVTTDGYLSACEIVPYGTKAGKMDPMIYAHYDEKADKIIYDQEKMRALQNRTLCQMPPECQACIAREHCAGFCLGETLNDNDCFYIIKPDVCRAVQYLYAEIGNLYPQKFPHGFPHQHP